MSKIERFVWLWSRRVIFMPIITPFAAVVWLFNPEDAKDFLHGVWIGDMTEYDKKHPGTDW